MSTHWCKVWIQTEKKKKMKKSDLQINIISWYFLSEMFPQSEVSGEKLDNTMSAEHTQWNIKYLETTSLYI